MKLEFKNEGFLTKTKEGRFSMNGISLSCGVKCLLYIASKGTWLPGRIRYHSGYCFYCENEGDIPLEEGMHMKPLEP